MQCKLVVIYLCVFSQHVFDNRVARLIFIFYDYNNESCTKLLFKMYHLFMLSFVKKNSLFLPLSVCVCVVGVVGGMFPKLFKES